MGKSKAPRPADPRDTAAAQTATNIATAIAQQNLNNINQVTPYGSLIYERSGEYKYVDPLKGGVHSIPQFTARQVLSDEQQEILDHNNDAGINLARLAAEQSAKLRQWFGDGFVPETPKAPDVNELYSGEYQTLSARPQLRQEIESAGGVQTNFGGGGDIVNSYGGDFSQSRRRVEDALLSRLSPRFEKDLENLEVKLANQGIRLGSQAYESALDSFNRKQTDARLAAILSAGQEQNRLAGLSARQAQFANAAQSQKFMQNERQARFANAAQQQAFLQNARRGEFANEAMLQDYANVGKQVASENNRHLFNRELSRERFDIMNALYNQKLNEQFAVRNQPINEISALLSGAQVRSPRFISPQVSKIGGVDFISAQNNYDRGMQNRYSQGIEGLLGFGKLFI